MSVMHPQDLSRCSDEELLRIGLEDVQALGVLGVFYDRYEDSAAGLLSAGVGACRSRG